MNYIIENGRRVLQHGVRIMKLETNEIFVFGSNRVGKHDKGAAEDAWRKHGAIYGQAEGLQGRSYGIPTKGKVMTHILTIGQIQKYVDRFVKFALSKPELTFLVTEIGCGRSKYNPKDIAPLFAQCLQMDNVVLPKRFVDVLTK